MTDGTVRRGRWPSDPVATPTVGRLSRLDPQGDWWRWNYLQRQIAVYTLNARLLQQTGARNNTSRGRSS